MPSWLFLVGKVVMKVTINTVVPGASSVVDFVETGACFHNKDYIGGCISTAFGIANIMSAGIFSAGKEAAQTAAKERREIWHPAQQKKLDQIWQKNLLQMLYTMMLNRF